MYYITILYIMHYWYIQNIYVKRVIILIKGKNIVRYREIISILAKNGFFFITNKIGSKIIFRNKKTDDIPLSVRIRHTIEELGPTYVKLGQLMSTRKDIIPSDIADELSKLQDKVKPFSYDDVKKIVNKELNRDMDDIFSYFEKEPIASASIAQVHKAVLKSTGETVAVKIQRPDIERKINSDIEILLDISRSLDVHFHIDYLSFYDIISEFTRSLKLELDFKLEARNTMKFKELFSDSDIVIPYIYSNYSTQRIMTMQYIKGISIKNPEELKNRGFNVKTIAYQCAQSFIRQVIDFGIFHADPHPGNILALKGNKIAYIDFGLVGHLNPHYKKFLYDLSNCFLNRDVESIIDDFEDLGSISVNTDISRLRNDLTEVIDYFYGASLKDISVSETINRLLNIIYKNKIILPSDFAMLLKAMITIEGVGQYLDPEFNITQALNDFTRQKYINGMNPKTYLKENLYTLKRISRMASKTPPLIYNILKKLESGNVNIKFTLEDLDKLRNELSEVSNKLSLSLIVSALIVGSSLAMQIKTGPKIMNLPAIGVIGFTMASVIGFWLIGAMFVNNIIKKRRNKDK